MLTLIVGYHNKYHRIKHYKTVIILNDLAVNSKRQQIYLSYIALTSTKVVSLVLNLIVKNIKSRREVSTSAIVRQ